MPVYQVCLGCGVLTANGSRCVPCGAKRERARSMRRVHYQGSYKTRSRQVRDAANADPSCVCWLCHEPARLGDPWTADHVTPGDPDSILLPAHRSCNSRRGDAKGRRAEAQRAMETR